MQQAKNIGALFLDIGGVLLSKGWGREFRKKAAEKFALDWDTFQDLHAKMFPVYELGNITLDDYLNHVIFYTDRNFSRQAFKDYMFSLSYPYPGMIAFIKKLKAHYGLKVIAVSNEAREINAYRIKTFRLNEVFDFFVSSCYVKARKPDTTIFQIALDGAQVPKEKIAYVDDVELYVQIASGLGIASIHHTDSITTVQALARLGLSLPEAVAKRPDIHNLAAVANDGGANLKQVGIASDHGGFELKGYLLERLAAAGYPVVDFGAFQYNKGDDYPDYVIPLSQAVAKGEISRGIAICGSGVGACITANKIDGVRAALITDAFPAQQGVEDDAMNIICLGGNITSPARAWTLVELFLNARFKEEERFIRRLHKVDLLENIRK